MDDETTRVLILRGMELADEQHELDEDRVIEIAEELNIDVRYAKLKAQTAYILQSTMEMYASLEGAVLDAGGVINFTANEIANMRGLDLFNILATNNIRFQFSLKTFTVKEGKDV
jgi:hypothetical protein